MPTARGWLVAGTGAALWLAGALFGPTALPRMALALLVLVVGAVAVVRLGRHEVSITRKVSPARVAAGRAITVTIQVHNQGRGAAPLMLLEDRLPVQVRGRARYTVQGIEPEGRRDIDIVLRTEGRGRYEIGPLDLYFTDPFRLARVRSHRPELSSFIVHPQVEKLSLPRDLGERRSLASSSLRQPTASQGEDFFTLREYVEGDDLRKVHWASTAKRGRLIIRKEETPWHTRATILLDDRRASYGGGATVAGFERGIEAAASLVDLYHRAGHGFRLLDVHQAGVGPGRGGQHRARCLDHLATIHPAAGDNSDALLLRAAELDSEGTAEASLVLITGELGPEEAAALARCRRRFRQVSVLMFPTHRFGTEETKARWAGEKQAVQMMTLLERSGVRAIVYGPDEPLDRAWRDPRVMRRGEGAWAPKPELV